MSNPHSHERVNSSAARTGSDSLPIPRCTKYPQVEQLGRFPSSQRLRHCGGSATLHASKTLSDVSGQVASGTVVGSLESASTMGATVVAGGDGWRELVRDAQAAHSKNASDETRRAVDIVCFLTSTRLADPRGALRRSRSQALLHERRVEIDDVGHAGFQKCSELSVEVANVQYFEGGSLIPNKSPGRLTFADVTLERGATQDRNLFDWLQDVAVTSSGFGLVDPYYKRNLDISATGQRRHHASPVVPVTRLAGEVRGG